MSATGHTVRRPQTDGHQECCYEPEHRSGHQRRNSPGLHSGDDGGDENEDGPDGVVKELRQRPVDAGHLSLQPEQVHEEEDDEGDEEPQRHHLEVLEGRPAGPTASTVDAQEGDEQGNHLSDLQQSRDGEAVAHVQDPVPGRPGVCCRCGDDGVRHVGGQSARAAVKLQQSLRRLGASQPV